MYVQMVKIDVVKVCDFFEMLFEECVFQECIDCGEKIELKDWMFEGYCKMFICQIGQYVYFEIVG